MSMYIIAKACPYSRCGTVTELTVDATSYDTWRAGALIQDAFPTMSLPDREFLMSGFCPTHMEVIFGGDALAAWEAEQEDEEELWA